MTDIPLPEHATIDISPVYRVQLGGYTFLLTTEQAFDLHLALNGLFEKHPSLAQRVEEVEITNATIWDDLNQRVTCEVREQLVPIRESLEQTKAHDPLFRQGKPWTKEEDDRLCELLHTDKTFPEIAVLMGRSAAGVQTRANYPNFYRIRHPKQAERDQERLSEASAAIATLVRERVTA